MWCRWRIWSEWVHLILTRNRYTHTKFQHLVICANINMFTNLSDGFKHEHLSETQGVYKFCENKNEIVNVGLYEASCDVLPLLSSHKIQFCQNFSIYWCLHIAICTISYWNLSTTYVINKFRYGPDNIWRYTNVFISVLSHNYLASTLLHNTR